MNAQKRLPYIDVLRGFAIAFMLVNHAAVKWLSKENLDSGFSGALTFMGSFAPVLFFFVTGLGYGTAHDRGKRAEIRPILVRAVLLVLIDIFMRGGHCGLFGWDFLAFIAFSMILLQVFRGRRHGLKGAAILLILLLILRYVVGEIYHRALLPEDQYSWLLIIFGLIGINGVSYWFTPWFAFPLLGFLFGAYLTNLKAIVITNAVKSFVLVFGVGLLIALLSYFFYLKGAILFRWGSMSINYFIASIACILICMAISLIITMSTKHPLFINLLAMNGTSSLAVVPIHYFFLHILAALFAQYFPLSATIYLFLMPIWIVFCFASARKINNFFKYYSIPIWKKYKLFLLCFVFFVGIYTTIFPHNNLSFLATFAAQFILCGLFYVYSIVTTPQPARLVNNDMERSPIKNF